MIYRCSKCDMRIDGKNAHPPTENELIAAIRRDNPNDPLWAKRPGPEQLYHTRIGSSCFGSGRQEAYDCGPLREENEGDEYIAWALANGGGLRSVRGR